MLWPYQNIATYQFKSTADHYHLGNKRFAFVIKFCFLNFWQSSKKKALCYFQFVHHSGNDRSTWALCIVGYWTAQCESFKYIPNNKSNMAIFYVKHSLASCSEEQNTGSNPSQVWAVRPAECRNISNRFSSSTQGTRRVKQSNLKNIHSWDEDFLSVPL